MNSPIRRMGISTPSDLQQAAISSLENPGSSAATLPKVDDSQKPILYIFRHCESTDNVERIFSGRRDPNLTKKGEEQAATLADLLQFKKIDLFLGPPQKRCEQTLAPIRALFPDVPYTSLENLKERDYGDLTGKNKLEIMKEFPNEAVLWRRSWDVSPPNGESLKQVWEDRVQPFCTSLEERMRKETINVGYCGTNNTIRLIRMYFEKLTIDQTLLLENPYGDYASYHIKP